MDSMRVGIIGAGATGLTAALRLSGRHDVALFEKGGPGGLGGIAGAVPIRGTWIDKFYHHIFTNDEHLVRLIDELGLGGEMLWKPAKNGLYLGSRLYPFTNPVDLILFPKVSLAGRLRMGFTVLGAKNIRDYSEMETVSAKEWLVKKAGRSAYETLWKPLLHSKFDEDADDVSGVWIWNKFKLRGSTRKGVNKEYLGYMRGGFIRLYRKMAEGMDIRYEAATRIAPKGGKLLVATAKGEELFDKVLFTGAAELLGGLCELPGGYRERLMAQKHKANICMTLVLRKPVSGYYWITVAEEGAPFVLMIEHTNLFGDPAYGGDSIVYLSRYLDASDPLFVAGDGAIREAFLGYLGKMFPAFDARDVLGCYVHRERHAQPVVFQRHSERVLPLRTPVDGLYLANMGQIYPEDRGQSHAVRLGEDAARAMEEDAARDAEGKGGAAPAAGADAGGGR